MTDVQNNGALIAGSVALTVGAVGAVFGYLGRKAAASSDINHQLFLRVSLLEKRDDEKAIIIQQLQNALHDAERKIDRLEAALTAKNETIKNMSEREKNMSEREKNTSEREKNTNEREKNTSEREKNTSEREKNTPKTGTQNDLA